LKLYRVNNNRILTLTEKVLALINQYMELSNYKVIENVQIRKRSTSVLHLDYLLEPLNPKRNPRIGIIIKDWKCSIGYHIIISIEEKFKSMNDIDKIIIVGTYFSESAQILALKAKILLLTSSELTELLSLEEKSINSFNSLIERIIQIQ
jgi:hypothetical protein